METLSNLGLKNNQIEQPAFSNRTSTQIGKQTALTSSQPIPLASNQPKPNATPKYGKKYSPPIAELDSTKDSLAIMFLDLVRTNQGKSTADLYRTFLSHFKRFLTTGNYGAVRAEGIDDVIAKAIDKSLDIYNVLALFTGYLSNHRNVVTNRPLAFTTKNQCVKTVRFFLEYNDVPINKIKFKLKIPLRKPVRKDKKALSKKIVQRILTAIAKTGDMELFTYVLLLAATGMRAAEALSVELRHLNFNGSDVTGVPYLQLRAEYTKTKSDRTVYLSAEVVQQLKSFIQWKYRGRKMTEEYERWVGVTGNVERGFFYPTMSTNDLLFGTMRRINIQAELVKQYGEGITSEQDYLRKVITTLYDKLRKRFTAVLNSDPELAEWEENGARHKITLHSLRRFVRTSISDIGLSDYAEFFIGHHNSVYWSKSDSEKELTFRKIEPLLTYLDVTTISEKQQSLIEELTNKDLQIRALKEKVQLYESQRNNRFFKSVEHYKQEEEVLLSTMPDEQKERYHTAVENMKGRWEVR